MLTEQRFEGVIIKMWGEDKPQSCIVSIGGDIENTEDFEYDGMVYYYFADEAEFLSAFTEGWDGSTGDFYILAIDKGE
jgi:hypothetical protein